MMIMHTAYRDHGNYSETVHLLTSTEKSNNWLTMIKSLSKSNTDSHAIQETIFDIENDIHWSIGFTCTK